MQTSSDRSRGAWSIDRVNAEPFGRKCRLGSDMALADFHQITDTVAFRVSDLAAVGVQRDGLGDALMPLLVVGGPPHDRGPASKISKDGAVRHRFEYSGIAHGLIFNHVKR